MSNEETSSSRGRISTSPDKPCYGMSLEEFLHRVNLNWEERIAPYIWQASDGCMLWQGRHTNDGYGMMRLGLYPSVRMHVLAYIWKHKVAIPKGIEVCHKCDVPDCMNPDHLFLGTKTENLRDMQEKGRKAVLYYSKLTAQQILDIKQLLREGKMTQMQIAKKFYVGQATISEIKNDRRPFFANTKDIRETGS